jgi:multisubunit Na+/H+ antiporter MnhF subunit
MSRLLLDTLEIALAVHLVLIMVCVWRVWRGENVIDRLIAADMVTMLVLSILVILALIQRSSIFIDIALGLAVLGSLSTIALAKYIADQKRF